MAWHGCWFVQFIATNIMESSSSWSKNMCSNQRCHASSDMNYTRPSEIYHPNPVNEEKQVMRSVSSKSQTIKVKKSCMPHPQRGVVLLALRKPLLLQILSTTTG